MLFLAPAGAIQPSLGVTAPSAPMTAMITDDAFSCSLSPWYFSLFLLPDVAVSGDCYIFCYYSCVLSFVHHHDVRLLDHPLIVCLIVPEAFPSDVRLHRVSHLVMVSMNDLTAHMLLSYFVLL